MLSGRACPSCGAPVGCLPGTLAVRCPSCGGVLHVVDEPVGGQAVAPSPGQPSPSPLELHTALAKARHDLDEAKQSDLSSAIGCILAGGAVLFASLMIVTGAAWLGLPGLAVGLGFFVWNVRRSRRAARAQTELTVRRDGLASMLGVDPEAAPQVASGARAR